LLNLKTEIITLILKEDFIILPGIGAFESKYSKPYFDENQELVLPKKTFEFINILNQDFDEKLFNKLNLNTSIPINLIKIEYNNFLTNFKKELKEFGKFEWENFGVFFRDQNQEISFLADTLISKSTLVNLNDEKPEERFSLEPKLEIEEVEGDENRKVGNKLNLYHKLLYILPLVLLFSGLLYLIFFKKSENIVLKESPVLDVGNFENTIDKELENNGPKDSKPKQKQEENKNEQSSKLEVQKSYKKLSIGVFRVKENVDNLTTYLAENGIPVKVRKDKNLYTVFVVASSDAQAIEFSDKIEQLTGEKPVLD
jgi:hypothetical protein